MDQVFCLEDHEENLDYDGTDDIILDNDVDEELIKAGETVTRQEHLRDQS